MIGDRPLRVGLMSFAHTHAAGYAQLLRDWPGVELLTTDPDGEGSAELRGAALAAELDVPYVPTYEDLLDRAPDAVVVCSENVNHRPLVELAARAGAHVLCEKPLATTVADAEAMVEACRAAGVFLMTAYPVRFAPSFAALRSLVDAGALGEVLLATGTNNGKVPAGRAWFTDPALAGGGALVDHTVHVADLLDALLERPLTRVRATVNHVLHADRPEVTAETGGLVSLTYAGGVEVVVDCSWSVPDEAPTWGGLTLEVFGTRGSAAIAPFSDRLDGFTPATGGAAWLPFGSNLDQLMLAAFLDGVRTGTPPQPDGGAGLRTVRAVVAAQESVRTGRPVDLEEPATTT
ncbi:Gfo/Idh/MocA family protein [Georgenia subflava]|uniref:Gfo/Idh/MocA family oxidoreductase n=1 Tax=Georgenia subflava TaxID=1622177 RepID=A0A6N7EEL6_9MICO|nr:Gfo/Idh/MocA family oxidoreductase [Georgenia subflava]MPV36470.1 gfo/Idh/MocA family oxidoreductase [Georgenia subflava]